MDNLHKEYFAIKKKQKEAFEDGLKQSVEIADKLKSMMSTPGWKILEEYLDDQTNIAVERLITADNDRNLYFNQAVVAVIKGIFENVGVSKKIAKSCSEILQKYENKD